MSAYLERLVNRLIQPEAEIQPRLPGLFEPRPRAQATGLEAAESVGAPRSEEPQGEAEEAQFPIDAVTSEDYWQNRPTSPIQPAAAEQAPLQPSQALQPTTPEYRAFVAPQPLQRSPGEGQAAPAGREGFHTLPAAAQVESAREDSPKGIGQREIAKPFKPEAAARTARTGTLPPLPASLQPIQPLEEPAAEPLPLPSRPILTRLASPEANSAKTAAAQDQPIQADSSAAPQIHITIGRIEVRAANPPPVVPRKPAARQGPVVSLEDYLKRRQGGSK
jgi:hypothetical protein